MLDDTLGETDEKLLPRIAVTYGVLRRLGFSEPTVDDCLSSIGGIQLDEAFDWVKLKLVLCLSAC